MFTPQLPPFLCQSVHEWDPCPEGHRDLMIFTCCLLLIMCLTSHSLVLPYSRWGQTLSAFWKPWWRPAVVETCRRKLGVKRCKLENCSRRTAINTYIQCDSSEMTQNYFLSKINPAVLVLVFLYFFPDSMSVSMPWKECVESLLMPSAVHMQHSMCCRPFWWGNADLINCNELWSIFTVSFIYPAIERKKGFKYFTLCVMNPFLNWNYGKKNQNIHFHDIVIVWALGF